jgi:hypothetical protein
MQGIGLAFKSLDTLSQHFTSKMLHGCWLNTGHQCKKFTKDPMSSLCPCCHAPNKTFEHIVRCTAPSVTKTRYIASTNQANYYALSPRQLAHSPGGYYSTSQQEEALLNWLIQVWRQDETPPSGRTLSQARSTNTT